MEKIIFTGDKYGMNWLREDYEYAQVLCPKEIKCEKTFERRGEVYYTELSLTNCGDKPLFTGVDTIGIRFPLEDRYDSSDVCIQRRCNAHLFCGGSSSSIMALRMGGESPHLGMVLTRGSLDSYSVERDLRQQSNDRGCFILHPSPMELEPGETAYIGWVIFPHEGREDFLKKAGGFGKHIQVRADRLVLFPGEQNAIRITPSFPAERVTVDGQELTASDGGEYTLEYTARECGEHTFIIRADNETVRCRVFVQEPLLKLAGKRCRFIADRQQYDGRISGLAGAYLPYDNEEGHIFYHRDYDFNGGRERVGMGLLIASYLQRNAGRTDVPGVKEECAVLKESLWRYTDYLKREIINMETGEVCNDFHLDNSYKRLYNFTWYAELFAELYQLTGDRTQLDDACRIMEAYYRQGGAEFYPIELPALLLDRELRKAGMEKERLSLREHFIRHADCIAETGLRYPASEVNYEQSIVAPAASILLQAHVLTGEKRYLEAGETQLRVLEQFNGNQPDYHLYEVAVRHWDGYWFGKNRQYGDTFPHYWSALTGNVYALYAHITNAASYKEKARASIRGVLPMFFRDGSASCAYVFPHRVNGVRGGGFDPYANDQDWGLYFALRLERELGWRV